MTAVRFLYGRSIASSSGKNNTVGANIVRPKLFRQAYGLPPPLKRRLCEIVSSHRGDSPRGGEMSPQVTKGTAQYEMPDRAEESFASLEKGGGTQCRRDIPLSLRDIPAQGTPFGRLFEGDYLKNWFV